MTGVLNAMDLMLARARQLRAMGPDLLIVHRFRRPGVVYCEPGEEVFAVFVEQGARKFQLPLSASQRIIVDYLARHWRVAQSAKQIELGIRASAFYQRHGLNARSGNALIRQIPRSGLREHIKRIHHGLALVFHEARLPLDPHGVLIMKETLSNEVTYRIRANFRWTHLDLTSHDSQPF